MTPSDALERLVHLHGSLERYGVEHRALCGVDAPDPVAIGRVRWRIASASLHRMDLLTGIVFPMVEHRGTGLEREAVGILRSGTSTYRGEVSKYVSRWSTSAVVADWATYRGEAKRFRAQVAARLTREHELLVPLLRRASIRPS